MGWETRRGRRYYTRSWKIAGRVVRQYVGGGEVGERAAAEDEAIREARRLERERWLTEASRFEAAERLVDDLCALTDHLLEQALLSAGYHRHDRGERRRARERGSEGAREWESGRVGERESGGTEGWIEGGWGRE